MCAFTVKDQCEFVRFPTVKDEWLKNCLRGLVYDDNGTINTISGLDYIQSSDKFEKQFMESKQYCRHRFMYPTENICNFIVGHVGSHFGNLQSVFKETVALRDKRTPAFEDNSLLSVHKLWEVRGQ